MAQRHSSIARRCAELAARVARHTDGRGNGIHPTAIAQLEFMRDDASTTICNVYEPAIAIVVQGKKEIWLGEETYHYGVAQYLVVSVELPVRGFIVEATPEQPYLGFLLKLSPLELFDIVAQVQPRTATPESSCRGLFVSDVDLPLIDCALRLTQLLNTPQDIPFLAPMIIREIYYRLLTGEQGEAIRQIATSGSNMQRIAGAIERIKAGFAQSLRVEALAAQANMSTSSFHRHFKSVTSMSPLQYQKQLRLLEARRLMLAENADATHAAYQVGYESPSQFSREYSRMFGVPPIQDIQRLRIA
ncbi:AraC family transcriptional regulator [Nodosilinea sp. LEGE 07088]|uniref:AraC family transcriptional regulator n=1 Tax=Nodosilinea sp. LEGE 07088 TaxID=2777968 RepID=UPI0018826B92|nr:AraC family transcriptional regulator [Nodosilinea sp. LEGE 07088]